MQGGGCRAAAFGLVALDNVFSHALPAYPCDPHQWPGNVQRTGATRAGFA